jgi:DNA-3-methyladenine glycosylase
MRPTLTVGGAPRLGRRFYARYTPTVARELLGCRLVRVEGRKRLSGIIVETEAYRGSGDPASHAYRGKTKRNEVMFGEPGRAYVYFTYGFHYCLNMTTEREGTPGAVLIRAIEPVEGVETMMARRGVEDAPRAADGPGKLTQALGIDRRLNGEDLTRSKMLFVEAGSVPSVVGKSTRVGIKLGVERRWRYYVKGSRFVSRGRPAVADSQNP